MKYKIVPIYKTHSYGANEISKIVNLFRLKSTSGRPKVIIKRYLIAKCSLFRFIINNL